jgi:hypothetical protein
MTGEKAGRVLKEALIGGLIAYVAVAVALGLVNVLEHRSLFHTAAALGTLLVGRSATGGAVNVAAGPVLAYNGVHLIGSIAVAALVAFEVFETERHHSLWYFFFMVLIAAAMYSIALFGVLGVELGGVIGWPVVVTGTVVWVGSMTAYAGWEHRRLVRSLRAELESAA